MMCRLSRCDKEHFVTVNGEDTSWKAQPNADIVEGIVAGKKRVQTATPGQYNDMRSNP